MRDTAAGAPSSLPRRMTWFAPWTWPCWTRWTAIALLPVLYIELPVPVAALAHRPNGPLLPPTLVSVLEIGYAPLSWAYLNVPAVESFYDAQFDAINAGIDAVAGP
jgi:hypothetical protein